MMYQFDMDFSLEKLIQNKTWKFHLENEFQKDYFKKLNSFLADEFQKKIIFPNPDQIFSAINHLDLQKVKIVIIGQDPYHGEGEAHGLSFSVKIGIKTPPSLKNIFKELESDLGIIKENSFLECWQKEGVLLLNSVLTVEKDKAGSHQKKGWENFTNEIISIINLHCEHVVFILWGSHAQKKSLLIDQSKHFIISGVHPSPLSSYRGFFGSKPFSKANEWLLKKGLKSVKW